MNNLITQIGNINDLETLKHLRYVISKRYECIRDIEDTKSQLAAKIGNIKCGDTVYFIEKAKQIKAVVERINKSNVIVRDNNTGCLVWLKHKQIFQ